MMRIIEVSKDATTVYLATLKYGWVEAVGHTINVDGHIFTAVPSGKKIIISEFVTGGKIYELPIPNLNDVLTKEESIDFLEKNVGSKLVEIIGKVGIDKFREEMIRARDLMIAEHGPNPIFTQKE